MKINNVIIEDTFSEAFEMYMVRLLITASTKELAKIAATESTGYGTSIIGCSAEAGIDCFMPSTETPDSRPGYIIIICANNKDTLDHEVLERIGMCTLPVPSTAVFNAMSNHTGTINTGEKLRFFGDGYEKQIRLYDKDMVSIPLMCDDFLVEKNFGFKKGIAGGNIIIFAKDPNSAFNASKSAVDSIKQVSNVITPFAGGIVASASKIGSKYSFLNASTNEQLCLSLKNNIPNSKIDENVNGVYEIVMNGLDIKSIELAMKHAIESAIKEHDVLKIDAANFEGKLGNHKIYLYDLL